MAIDVDKLEKTTAQGGEPRTLNAVYEKIKEGPRSVMLYIIETCHIVSKKELDTDREDLYVYRDGFYSRGEEELRKLAYDRFTGQWQHALDIISEIIKGMNESDPDTLKKLLGIKNELKEMLKVGPSKGKIDEVLAQIRIHTFRDAADFNPPTHIPFRNGLLRIEDWTLVEFSPEIIFLWRVEANFLVNKFRNISLNDCPAYKDFLLGSYEPWDIPMLLQYGGYAFYPAFPRQMTMWIVGRPRIGKGTNARIWRGLNPQGYGAISFEKLMIAENKFAFQHIEGKNLLVDPEVKRKFKKGSRPDYGNFNKLFGGDTVDLEKKGKEALDYVSNGKGLFIANLPLPQVDDEPFLSRVLLVKARDRMLAKNEIVTGLDEVILNVERDQIATLFVRYLKVLKDRKFSFISELSTDATMEIWDLFANVIQFYLEEMVEYEEGAQIKCDEMYDSFKDWCQRKGIPVTKPQSFKKSVGYVYTKKKAGPKKKRFYVFTNCAFTDEVTSQVGHQSNDEKTRDIRALYYRNRECPTESYTLDVRRENQISSKVIEPKLDTDNFSSEKPEIQASRRNEKVSNFESDFREKTSFQEGETFKSWLCSFVETNAPKSKYHSLRAEDIYDMMSPGDPNRDMDIIGRTLQKAMTEGFLQKHGQGYRFNWEGN